MERAYKTKSVLISGAANQWGDWQSGRAPVFIRGLGKTLIDKDYRIVSGFGYSVGSAVISGALERVYATRRSRIDDQLILRPFPQEAVADMPWPESLKRYRDDLTDYAGAAIFLFGNKLRDGQVVLSDGVVQEFEIAREKGLAVIPVGATGFVAKQLWDKVIADPAAYYPNDTAKFKPLLDVLGDTQAKPEALIEAIVTMLALWAKG